MSVYTVQITDAHSHLGLPAGAVAMFDDEGAAPLPGEVAALWLKSRREHPPELVRISTAATPRWLVAKGVVMIDYGVGGKKAHYLSHVERVDKLIEVVE